jgi:hypothetical protein
MAETPAAKSSAATAPQPAPAGQAIMRSPLYRITYATGFQFRLSPMDFNVIFGCSTGLPTGQNVMQEEISVMMALPTLKLLKEHLDMALEVIEAEIGPIKVPAQGRPTAANREALMQALNIRNNPLAT